MTSTTIEKNYTTNPIIKDWLTLKVKFNEKINDESIEKLIDKLGITVEEM